MHGIALSRDSNRRALSPQTYIPVFCKSRKVSHTQSMALTKAARTAGVFRLSRLRANRLKARDPGAPRRKRTCPRPLANVPQRGWKRIRPSTLSQGISEKKIPAVPSSLLFISSMVHYTSAHIIYKWIASGIPRGLATGLASEYNGENFLTLRFPAVLPQGVFNFRQLQPQ